MMAFRFIGFCISACLLGTSVQQHAAFSRPASPNAQIQSVDSRRDGQHNFDFNFGIWKTKIKRLRHPLTQAKEWIDLSGTVTVSKVWNGRANLEEIEVDGPNGHLEGLTLRLYNSESHQWSLYWSNSNDGILDRPTVGEFKNGRGEFYDQEPFNGRMIFSAIRLFSYIRRFRAIGTSILG